MLSIPIRTDINQLKQMMSRYPEQKFRGTQLDDVNRAYVAVCAAMDPIKEKIFDEDMRK